MFVLEALTLTFMTTPLVTWLYPPEKRKRITATGVSFSNVADNEPRVRSASRENSNDCRHRKTRFTVVLDKIDHLPGMMALTQLLHSPFDVVTKMASGSTKKSSGLFFDAFRLIELSDRTSAVMKSSVADVLLHTDPLLAIFRTFGELHDLPVSTSLSVVPYDDLAYSVVDQAKNNMSQLILVPWLPPSVSNKTDAIDGATTPKVSSQVTNPFDALFKSGTRDKSANAIHSQFVRGVFSQSKTDVALFIDQGHTPGAINAQHIFLPFFGGPDDRLALEFVVQLCANPRISASVVRITKKDMDMALVDQAEPVYLSAEKAQRDNLEVADNLLSVHSVRYILSREQIRLTCAFSLSRPRASRIPFMVKPIHKHACNRRRRITRHGATSQLVYQKKTMKELPA
jgi:hypothetical protein